MLRNAEAFVNLIIIVCAGIVVLLKLPDLQTMGARRNRLTKEKENKKIYVKYLKLVGLNISPSLYRRAQAIISVLVITYLILIASTTKRMPILEFVISVLVVLMITPKSGTRIISWFKRKFAGNNVKIQGEIYQSLLVIKTLAVNDYQSNSLDILMKIASGCTIIEPNLNKVFQGWNNTNKEDLIEEFIAEIGTTEAKELGSILHKLDDVNTAEFSEQVDLYLDKIVARRQTQKESDDRKNGVRFFTLNIAIFMIMMMIFIFIVLNESMQMMYGY